jgi:hypothetical protein
MRAEIVLLAADGVSNLAIAERTGRAVVVPGRSSLERRRQDQRR